MKHLYLSFLLFIVYSGYAQQNLSFTYDEAGNQKIRKIICINCRTPNDNDASQTTADFTETNDSSKISVYPNPVQEELFIKWQTSEEKYMNSIQVYTIQGQMVYSKDDLSQTNTISIAFNNYAQGIYIVILIYNNGEKKDLKIIKK